MRFIGPPLGGALFALVGLTGVVLVDSTSFEAITTSLRRTLTIALFEAAIFAVGWYALLVNVAALQTGRLPRSLGLLGVVFGGLFILDRILPDGATLIAPLGSIGWAVGVGVFLWREASGSPTAGAG